MVERREKHRRDYKTTTQFPLQTYTGEVVTSERRRLPTRRVNYIQVELDYLKFLAKWQWN
jgi:hypothetical protein